uniref:Uncharacterized protein n=1 Tax=Plectus sambesii TaxID=2011161 RepID=A0A914WRU3_9BILA
MFLQSAVGYYHGFLLRLQREFGVDVNVDVSLCCVASVDKQSFERRTWGLAAVRKTLICLGDLMRYSLDLSSNEQDFYLAEHYYLEAYAIDPTQGMAMNQLGTLAEQRNFGIDALFYYLRGLLSKESFEGTRGNISFVLKRAKKTWEQLNSGDADKFTCADQFKLAFVTLMEIYFEDVQISPQEFAVFCPNGRQEEQFIASTQRCIACQPTGGHGATR